MSIGGEPWLDGRDEDIWRERRLRRLTTTGRNLYKKGSAISDPAMLLVPSINQKV